MTETKIIDTHLHVWDIAAPWMGWLEDRPASWDVIRHDFGFGQLRSLLDDAGVGSLVLVQAAPDVRESEPLLAIADAQPSVLGVAGWATLSSPTGTARDLDRLATAPGADQLLGIRTNQGWAPDGDVLAAPGVVDAARVVACRGLPLDVHLRDDTELPLVLDLARRLPELTIVIDHLGKPRLGEPDTFGSWAEAMRRLAAMPRVFVKCSGWATFVGRAEADDLQPYVDVVLDAFGSHRVMYGGNWPVALVADSYERTLQATLDAVSGRSRAEQDNVLHHAALACYDPSGQRGNS